MPRSSLCPVLYPNRLHPTLPCWAVLFWALLSLTACQSSYRSSEVDLDDLRDVMLVDPSILSRGSEDQALYRYVRPGIAAGTYTRVIVEPVLICKADSLSEAQLRDLQALAHNAQVLLQEELAKVANLTNKPGPGTLRIRVAVVEAVEGSPARNFVSSVLPVGLGASLIGYAGTGEWKHTGSLTVQLAAFDAQSGDLVGAAVDRRVGGKSAEGFLDGWAGANDALRYWAKRLSYMVCKGIARQDCPKP